MENLKENIKSTIKTRKKALEKCLTPEKRAASAKINVPEEKGEERHGEKKAIRMEAVTPKRIIL